MTAEAGQVLHDPVASVFQGPVQSAPALREQLSKAHVLRAVDQACGKAGVEMPDALERKYLRAGASWPWFWVASSARDAPRTDHRDSPPPRPTYLGPTPLNTTACTFATVCSKNAGLASVCPVSASTCTAKSA